MDNDLAIFGDERHETQASSSQHRYPTNNFDMEETAINDTSTYYYSDGDVIEQQWHGLFVFLAYLTAYVGAYGAIRLLEHALWRSEKERENASSKKDISVKE